MLNFQSILNDFNFDHKMALVFSFSVLGLGRTIVGGGRGSMIGEDNLINLAFFS